MNETKQKPTFDIVKKLADVLEATVCYLLEATEEYKTLKSPSIMKSLN